nr:GMC family oxidoreductase N-terminal domain-containing protein [Labilithrix luteola]
MNQASANIGDTPDIATRIRENQEKLAAELGRQFDFIVCGAGTSGSVIAGRLAANPDVKVLLLEAGDTDVRRSGQPSSERTRHPLLDGQGVGWRFEHQRIDMVARASSGLGRLRGCGVGIPILFISKDGSAESDGADRGAGDTHPF